MRYALDILAILMVVPKVQLVLADTVDVLDESRSPVSTVGQYETHTSLSFVLPAHKQLRLRVSCVHSLRGVCLQITQFPGDRSRDQQQL